MKIANVVLVGLIVVVVAVAGWVALDYYEKESKNVDYSIEGYCYEEGIGTFTVTLHQHKEISEGTMHDGSRFIPIQFTDGRGVFTGPSPRYVPGPLVVGPWCDLEVPGFTTHRV